MVPQEVGDILSPFLSCNTPNPTEEIGNNSRLFSLISFGYVRGIQPLNRRQQATGRIPEIARSTTSRSSSRYSGPSSSVLFSFPLINPLVTQQDSRTSPDTKATSTNSEGSYAIQVSLRPPNFLLPRRWTRGPKKGDGRGVKDAARMLDGTCGLVIGVDTSSDDDDVSVIFSPGGSQLTFRRPVAMTICKWTGQAKRTLKRTRPTSRPQYDPSSW